MLSPRDIGRTIRREGSSCPPMRSASCVLTPSQYAAFGRALAAAKAGGAPWQAVEALRLLALTGARAGEIVNLKRSECDFRNSLLALADTETGASLRPLGKAAAEVLKRVLALSDGPDRRRPSTFVADRHRSAN